MEAASDAEGARPTICLSMIVRDEAHCVTAAIDSLAPYLDHWVIVDTGSKDGTQELIRSHMGELGIAGELKERPWVDFGTNRSEALELAAGKADYIWVIDADDQLVGEPDLDSLERDSYLLRYGPDFSYWRKQIFRDGLRWRYEAVVHEYPVCDDPASEQRLGGDYHVTSGRHGSRSADPRKYERDVALLLDALDADPQDGRSAFYLAQSYLDSGDPKSALEWYEQRIEMGGFDEELYYSRFQRGVCLERMETPWEKALAAYLDAHEFRPSRAEPLHAIAKHHRMAGEYATGRIFAERAAAIPYPAEEKLFVAADVYRWRCRDELAICASYAGENRLSFDLFSALLEEPLHPEDAERIAGNRDLCAERLVEPSRTYPAVLIARLAGRQPDPGADVTLTITSARRLDLLERTLNSFLNSCEDLDRIARFVCADNGSSSADRARMRSRYPFLELIETEPPRERQADSLNLLAEQVRTPYWLHLEDDWDFFAPFRYIERAVAILDDDPEIAQVAFNPRYGETLEDRRRVVGGLPRRTSAGDRYLLHEHLPRGSEALRRCVEGLEPGHGTSAYWPHFTLRPSLMRTEAIRRQLPFSTGPGHFELEFAERYAAAGLRTAFLPSMVAIHTGRLTRDAGGGTGDAVSAYELIGDGSHPARGAVPVSPPPPDLGEVEVRVLNLDRRGDRLTSFLATAAGEAGAGFAARIVRTAAVDGRELELTPEIRHDFRSNDFGFRRGIIGCALSHMALWRELAGSDVSARLIFEDDARLLAGFAERLDSLCEWLTAERPGFDMALLGYFAWEDAEPDGDPPESPARSMRWERYLGGSFAYLLSRRGARHLLGLVERDGVQNGIDWFVMRKESELDVVEATPQFVTAPLAVPGSDTDSDIEHEYETLLPPSV